MAAVIAVGFLGCAAAIIIVVKTLTAASDSPEVAPPPMIEQAAEFAGSEEDEMPAPLLVESAEMKVMEKSDRWSKVAWVVKVQSNADIPLLANIAVDFIDADGFVIDSDVSHRLPVKARSQATTQGTLLILSPQDANVAEIVAHVEPSEYQPPVPRHAD